jgi:hypothetical protein
VPHYGSDQTSDVRYALLQQATGFRWPLTVGSRTISANGTVTNGRPDGISRYHPVPFAPIDAIP